MAVLVVDLLELIKVSHDDVAVRLLGQLLRDVTRDVFLELRPVVELCELIDGYLVVQ